jgi:hypothetical protein
MSPDDPRHGTPQGRPAHRRAGEPACDPCREANALYQRRYRKTRALHGDKSVDATGTRRRVQALCVLGWSTTQIAERIDMVQNQLWMTTQQETVYRSTAARVAEIYDVLSMSVPPTTTTSERISVSRTKSHAIRAGWAPPLAWDDIDDPNEQPNFGGADDAIDPVVVSRILGQDASLAHVATAAERRAVVAVWPGSMASLERLTGWRTDRYVTREDGVA